MMNRAARRKMAAENRHMKAASKKRGFKTGYVGQSHEVSCIYNGQENYVVGWTNDPTGGGLMRMVELHPAMSSPKVRELTDADKRILSSLTITKH